MTDEDLNLSDAVVCFHEKSTTVNKSQNVPIIILMLLLQLLTYTCLLQQVSYNEKRNAFNDFVIRSCFEWCMILYFYEVERNKKLTPCS